MAVAVTDSDYQPFDALCVGETMAMVTPTPGGRLDGASTFVLRAGGAESNVAMFLAALGHRAAWASRLGDDPLGRLVLSQVASTGVDTSLVEISPELPTGVYFKDPQPGGTNVYYYRRGSAAAGMDGAFARRLSAVSSAILHISGITVALSDSCRELIDVLIDSRARSSQLLSVDVNYRPALWSRPPAAELRRLAQAADIVFVGLDEAETLWGVRSPEEVRDLIDRPATLVVKNGSVNAMAFYPGGQAEAPALAAEVVEPVGAGDAFAAGWLSGALRRLDHVTRLKLGHLVARAALGSVGDYAAMPPAEEICAALGMPPDAWHVHTATTNKAG